MLLFPVALLSFAPALLHTRDAHVALATRSATPYMMAGFGAAASKKPSKKAKSGKGKGSKGTPLDANKQWSIYSDLRELDDVTRTSVYARLPDEGEKWKQVGGCVVQPPGSRQQAVMLHKRLILEHAARLYPSLAVRSRELLCGYTDLPGSMQSREEDIVTLVKCDVPSELKAGFCGLPDEKTSMYTTKAGAPKDVQKKIGSNRDSRGRM